MTPQFHEGIIDFQQIKDECISGLSNREYNELVERHMKDIPDELELFRSFDQIVNIPNEQEFHRRYSYSYPTD